MTSKETAIHLTKENLHQVFGETDAKKRFEAMARIWVPSEEALFIDPLGVFRSYEAISGLIVKLQEEGPGDVFSEIGDVDVLSYDEREDLWVTRLKWSVGLKGGEAKLTGEDVVTIVGGRVKTLYTFLDSK